MNSGPSRSSSTTRSSMRTSNLLRSMLPARLTRSSTSPYVMRWSPHSIATRPPRPSLTLRSTNQLAALNVSGSAITRLSYRGWWISIGSRDPGSGIRKSGAKRNHSYQAMHDFISVDGARLEYAWHGPAPVHAPTMVFLHEGLGSISQWRSFPADLCARLGCGGLVYSRRGDGKSDAWPAPRTTQLMHHEALTVLPRLVDTFDIKRPILVGHSDG